MNKWLFLVEPSWSVGDIGLNPSRPSEFIPLISLAFHIPKKLILAPISSLSLTDDGK